MSLDDYYSIIAQCRGRTFQIALGGAGDPNKHEFFADILRVTRENKIVPNYTTSGYDLTDREVEWTKKYCGAVAVSYYSKLDKDGNEDNFSTIDAIERFVRAGCITNVHYVLSRKNIMEAIYRVKNSVSVSYTHLDVYKRQDLNRPSAGFTASTGIFQPRPS